MATSETVIGNAALGKLGQPGVLDFDVEDDSARWLKARFGPIRDLVLRNYPWTFAMRRKRLSADTEAPAFGYARQFRLPDDFLRLVEVAGVYVPVNGADYKADTAGDYSIEGGFLLTDAAAPLDIRYVARVIDTTAWDPLFDEAMACRLAADLAEKLTQSSAKKEAALRDYQLSVREAVRVNAIERAPEGRVDGSWITGRL